MKTLKVVRDTKGIVIGTYEVGVTNENTIPVEIVQEGKQTAEVMEQVPESYLLDLPGFLKKCRKP